MRFNNKELHRAYNPRRWLLVKVLSKIQSLKEKLFGTPKKTKGWFVTKMKLEVEQMKKHAIIMETLLERYDREE